VLAVSGCTAVLLGFAVLVHHSALVLPAAMLGTACSGGGAAYALDDDAATLSDATPTSRRYRLLWRIPVLALPAVIACTGLTLLDHLDPTVPWLRLMPFLAGALSIGISLAAVLRARFDAPGDLAAPITVGTLVLDATIDPLKPWATALPLAANARPGPSYVLWLAVVIASIMLTLTRIRDPGRRRRHCRTGKSVSNGIVSAV